MEPGSIPVGRKRDPRHASCRICKHWDGDRSWPLEEGRTGQCCVDLPPYLSKALDKLDVKRVTRAKDLCRFYDEHHPPVFG